MFPLIKLLKIVLPVTTVTVATIATVSLVSFKKEDSKSGLEKEDRVLEDFEKQAEDFKEQIMLYSEEGQGDGITVSEEMKQKLLEQNLDKDKLKQTTKEPKDIGLSKLPEGLKTDEQDVNKKSSIDSNSSSFVRGKTQDAASVDLSPSLESANNQVDSDSPQDTEKAEQGQNGQEQTPIESKEPTDSEEVGSKVDIKSSASVSDKPETDERDNPTNKLNVSEGKESLPETKYSDQDGKGTESSLDSQERGEHQSETTDSNLSKGNSDFSPGDHRGVLNESGSDPMTQERLNELIQLGNSASTALDGLKQLLLV